MTDHQISGQPCTCTTIWVITLRLSVERTLASDAQLEGVENAYASNALQRMFKISNRKTVH